MGTTEAEWLQALRAERSEVSRSSTAKRVADLLRVQVTEGRLLPGARLSEERVRGALGVSRNTLREAFRLLSHEGLLVHEFNRGVFVRSLTAQDVRDLYRLRRILETAAVREYDGQRAQAGRLTAVRAAVEEGEVAAAAGRWIELGTANMRFHQALAGLADSPRVDDVMRQLLAELRLVFHVMAAPREFHEPYLDDNRRILRLLEDGEPDAAVGVLESYLDAAERQLVEAFEQRHPDPS